MTDSPFILSKINTSNPENKQYIKELIQLLDYIKNPPDDLKGIVFYKITKKKFPQEYEALKNETGQFLSEQEKSLLQLKETIRQKINIHNKKSQ
jgi:hypothetical protein